MMGISSVPSEIEEIRKKFSYFSLSSNSNYDFLFIEDAYSTIYGWYIFDFDKSIVEELNNEISTFLTRKGYKKENVTSFGFSKGGTGALLYGLINENIGKVFSGTPQINMHKFFINTRHEVLKELVTPSTKFRPFENLEIGKEKQIYIISGIKEENLEDHLSFCETLTSKNIHVNLMIENSGYFHGDILIKNHVDICMAVLNFLDSDKVYINDSFDLVSKNFESYKVT